MTVVENIKNEIDEAGMDVEGDIDPRVYELGYHIIPAVSEEEAPKEALAIKEFITKHGGAVISDELPKHIDLAYDMFRTENGKKKFETAHFGGIKFEMDPINIVKLKEVLDINKNILRYIIFKTVKENTRSEIRFPQARTDKKQTASPKTHTVKEEKNVPISEEALDKSIEEIVVK